jgi:chitinase
MRLRWLALRVFLLMAASLPLSAPISAQTAYRIVGYFASWSIYDRGYRVPEIPADKLTHLNYAFASISDNGEIALMDEWADTQFPYPGDADDQPLKGNFHQLQLLKAAHPNLKTLISIGGWTGSANFSDVALTPESREKFASSVLAFVQQYGFDGADLDWEYPTGGGDPGNTVRPQDKENFVLLLDALHTALNAGGRHYLLTIALGAGEDNYQPLDWARIMPLLDWVNVMTYDMSGEWSTVTGFNAPLYDSQFNPPEGGSTDRSVKGILAAGVPPEKLVVGVPFYGRGWAGVMPQNNGLHQPYKTMADGTTEAGSYDYYDLAANYVGKFARFWSDAAQVPWLYDANTGITISYDDPESLGKKAEYVRANGLGGIMFWEVSQDTSDSALVNAIYDGLNGKQAPPKP